MGSQGSELVVTGGGVLGMVWVIEGRSYMHKEMNGGSNI